MEVRGQCDYGSHWSLVASDPLTAHFKALFSFKLAMRALCSHSLALTPASSYALLSLPLVP